jgi:hypothetical protein
MDLKYRELLDLDVALRTEADVMLRETGLGKMISMEGYRSVGSYAMHTMTWRDLDFERAVDPPKWAEHWEFGRQLAETGLIWKFSCVDAYRDRRNPGDRGLYWGVQFDYPAGGPVWKVDLWSARHGEFEGLPRRALWMSRLNDESRSHILEIKEAVWSHPDYRKALLSVHIYEAVLEHDVCGVDRFWTWWKSMYGNAPRAVEP